MKKFIFNLNRELLSLDVQDQIYETPVVVLQDINHALFASGEMPPRVEEEDIPSSLDDKIAKELIAEANGYFMAYHTEVYKYMGNINLFGCHL